uniref:At1g61320/AtMIF1 LRR domain-containing protein n=1 Tax=Aegilops tauschii TaxID=37682 RepID=R7WDI8_AEGTA
MSAQLHSFLHLLRCPVVIPLSSSVKSEGEETVDASILTEKSEETIRLLILVVRGSKSSYLSDQKLRPIDQVYYTKTVGFYDMGFLDIWCHIHSLMTLRDAARAACVSHAFQNSWKCYPNLIFNTRTVVLRDGMDFACRVDHILKKHSGIGVKTFELNFPFFYKSDAYKYLHRWLEIVVKPGIEKLTLAIPEIEEVNFPCQVLSDANFSLGESLQLKNLEMLCCRLLYYALEELPSIAPNLETFSIFSFHEVVLIQQKCIDELLSKDPTHLRKLPGYRLDKLKTVKISRFCSSKSLVELTCHILENSASLERLALDTTGGGLRCSDRRSRKCSFLHRSMDAHTAVLVIGKYIVGKVRPRVKLDVVEPCIWCHTLDP